MFPFTVRYNSLLLLLAIGATAPLVQAQDVQEISGEIRSLQAGRMEVQAGEKRWSVLIDSELLQRAKQHTELEFHGRGRASIVARGLWVHFLADVDASGKVTSPLRKLTWFTPLHSTQEGAFPAEPRDGREPLVAWDRPLRGGLIAGRYLIVGSVRAVVDGQMLVIYKDDGAERQVLAQLSPNVDVEIDITHKELAGKMMERGDQVEIRGYQHEKLWHALSIVARRETPIGQPLPTPRAPRRSADAGLLDDPLADLDRPVAENPPPSSPPVDSPKPSRARILKVN